jgi:hypothetical protein
MLANRLEALGLALSVKSDGSCLPTLTASADCCHDQYRSILTAWGASSPAKCRRCSPQVQVVRPRFAAGAPPGPAPSSTAEPACTRKPPGRAPALGDVGFRQHRSGGLGSAVDVHEQMPSTSVSRTIGPTVAHGARRSRPSTTLVAPWRSPCDSLDAQIRHRSGCSSR